MRRVETAVMSAAAAAAAVFLAFQPHNTADYARDAGPSLHPLVNGDFTAAFAHQPAMGWFAIVFRTPFAFFARHGSSLLEYELGSIPCLLLMAALGVWLATNMRRRNATLLATWLVLALAVLGPMNWHAIADGHPEEILGAALCVIAVVAAASGRSPLAAGLLLGLALGTKQWAILAAGPALLAAPRGRAQIAVTAIALAGAITFMPVLIGSHQALSPASSVSHANTFIEPASLWWPLGHVHHVQAPGWTVEVHSLPRRVANLTHPLIVALGVLLPLALIRRAPASRETALTLLALLFLLRCVLDPMTVGYYHVPLLVALVALEALHRRGLPLLTLISSAVMWVLVARIPWGLEPNKVATIYLAWALPLAAYLGAKVYAPTVTSSLGKWLSTSLPSSVTTTRSSIRTPNAPGM
ncbi:MAG TPA: hypothetical protein VF032_12705 [Thermoleophilaceae bacterium]